MSARNLVTPEDVGLRVSFQYELPNGYVGEVVGVMGSFDQAADTYILTDKNGAIVRVPRAGIRHGRVVGPPPDRARTR